MQTPQARPETAQASRYIHTYIPRLVAGAGAVCIRWWTASSAAGVFRKHQQQLPPAPYIQYIHTMGRASGGSFVGGGGGLGQSLDSRAQGSERLTD